MFQKEIFGERLLVLRSESGLSQQTLGNIVGLTKAAISIMEKGGRAPSVEVLCSLADYFAVSVDYLVGHSDSQEAR